MYNAPSLIKGLSLTKIIGGISKTLQVANQIIPLYYKTKPLIKNARNVFSILKTTSSKKEENQKKIETNKTDTTSLKTTEKKKATPTSSPTFFL